MFIVFSRLSLLLILVMLNFLCSFSDSLLIISELKVRFFILLFWLIFFFGMLLVMLSMVRRWFFMLLGIVFFFLVYCWNDFWLV